MGAEAYEGETDQGAYTSEYSQISRNLDMEMR